MVRIFQIAVVPFVLLLASAGLVAVAPAILAQPPEFDKGKGFDKDKKFDKDKGFEKKKGFDRPAEKAPPSPSTTDAVKSLEADLEKLKALEADIQAQLKRLKETPAAPTPVPPAAPDERGPGGRGPGGFGPGGFGFRGPGGVGGGMPRGSLWLAQGISRAFQSMTADQLKEVIAELEKLRLEKLRAVAPVPRPKEGRSEPEGSRAGTPGKSESDEILKRLDRLSQELEDIRKSLKR
jgi:hypothetical protein